MLIFILIKEALRSSINNTTIIAPHATIIKRQKPIASRIATPKGYQYFCVSSISCANVIETGQSNVSHNNRAFQLIDVYQLMHLESSDIL